MLLKHTVCMYVCMYGMYDVCMYGRTSLSSASLASMTSKPETPFTIASAITTSAKVPTMQFLSTHVKASLEQVYVHTYIQYIHTVHTYIHTVHTYIHTNRDLYY